MSTLTYRLPSDGSAADRLNVADQPLFARLSAAFSTARSAYLARRAVREAEARLADLDDRMLKDIGLTRSEISSALVNEGNERLNGAQRR